MRRTNTDSSRQTFYSSPEILLRLTLSLIPGKGFSESIRTALHTLGETSQHDRIHIFEVHPNMTYSVVHEWYHRELEPTPEPFKHKPVWHERPLEEQLCTHNYIILKDSDPTLSSDSRTFLREITCHQMLILPLFESGSQFAFIAFMQCRQIHPWEEEEIRFLSDVASVIARQIDNHRLLMHLHNHLRQIKKEKESLEKCYTQLEHIQKEIIPVWEHLKNNMAPPAGESIPEIQKLDRFFRDMDKICHTIPVK